MIIKIRNDYCVTKSANIRVNTNQFKSTVVYKQNNLLFKQLALIEFIITLPKITNSMKKICKS